jgi:hypothetical protein
VPSVYEPAEINVFAMMKIACGRVREVRSHLLEREGLRFAAAQVLGLEELDLLVEVTGDDLERVHETLLEITDLDAFTSCRTFVVKASNASGWGDASALG